MNAHSRHLAVAASCLAAFLSAAPALAAEGFHVSKTFDLAPGDRFTLDSSLGGVELHGVAGRRATIVVTSDRADLADRYDFRFSHESGELKLVVRKKTQGWFQSFRGNAKIVVEVPRATPVDLQTSGGAIDVSSLEATVRASSSGGGIKIADIRGEVFAESSGGGLKLIAVSGDIQASSSGGGVTIEEAGSRVTAESSGGPVRVLFAAGNSKGGDLGSSGGGVVATVDPAAGIDLDASSSGGSVTCDFPVTIQGRVSSNSVVGKLNGGGARLRVRSSGGGITLKPR
jgi:hypothetical protein